MQRLKEMFGWRQGDARDRAIAGLTKMLKRQLGSGFQELERVLNFPEAPSKCIVLPRTYDARIEVAGVRDYPHLISCRVFRWKDLQSRHEIEPIEDCEHPFSMSPFSIAPKDICINPYHYKRRDKTVNLAPILVPRYRKPQSTSPRRKLPVVYVPSLEPRMTPLNIADSPPGAAGGLNMSSNEPGPSSSLSPSTSSPGSSQPQIQIETEKPETLLPNLSQLDEPSKEKDTRAQDTSAVEYEEPKHWSSIAYFEFNCRIGETQYFRNTNINVDVFSKPDNDLDRFCIGNLAHVNPDYIIEGTRRSIGKGILLSYVEGSVFAESFCNCAVYVQSLHYNRCNNFRDNAVCRMPSDGSIEIFSTLAFADALGQTVSQGFDAVLELTKMCTVRMAFAEGWGAGYDKKALTKTRCWIEINLLGGIRWLNKVLVLIKPTLGAPPVS